MRTSLISAGLDGIYGTKDDLIWPKNHSKSFPQVAWPLAAGLPLVEMLVVIGIITLLLGILLPVVNRAYAYAIRNSMQHDLQHHFDSAAGGLQQRGQQR